MKITDVRIESCPRGARVAARVGWEDSDRPALDIYFETAAEFAAGLSPDSEAFAIGCAIPALSHGERRLSIEGSICPRLREGLASAGALLRGWYGTSVADLAIEPKEGFRPHRSVDPPRTAMFLSGGIDSLFTLVANRSDFPSDHPCRVRDAIVVRGFSFFPSDTERASDVWRRTRRAVERIARADELVPILVDTNLRELEPDFTLFASRYFGSMLSAVAHALSRRLSAAVVAADLDIARLFPWGAHPLLYEFSSSSAVEITDVGEHRSRLEKTRFLAARPDLLENVMVCAEGPLAGDAPNCGRCEKCVRTMLALMIAGASESAREAFAIRDITVSAIRHIESGSTPFTIPYFWPEIIAALDESGRSDLAEAGRGLLERLRRMERWHHNEGWTGRARRIDRRLFGGALLRARRRALGRPGGRPGVPS